MPGEAANLRFAVLHHTGVSSPHYDLLIETAPDALLLTFRCENWPLSVGAQIIRQPDHRRMYLDYEGPISRDRGAVTRVASGDCRIIGISRERIEVETSPAPCLQTLVLKSSDGEHWRVSISPDA